MSSDEVKHAGRRWLTAGFLALLAIAVAEGVFIWRRETRGTGSAPPAAPATATGRKILYWYDPMHPAYKSDKPGKAPDCGMDLEPVYEEPVAQPASGARVSLPESAFRITPEKQQLIGVQYGIVARQPLTKKIRAVARLAYDETRIRRVYSRIEGWIDKVYVDFTGQLVSKGQPLIAVYSPEVLATQEEYLLALKAREKLGGSAYKEVSAGAISLLGAARRRLELWDVPDQLISELEKTGKPSRSLVLPSPAAGFVLSRNSYVNQKITPETELYAIADLSTIWAIADFYEYEVHDVRMGQRIVLTVSSFPGRTFEGKVTYIYPQLADSTRTLRVRAEFLNSGFALKPDMYADANLEISYGRRLAVPQEAVLDSGAEQRVFVAHEGGYFEPRKVELGDNVDGKFIVLGGLREGEKIVTSGNFLVDSESTLKAAAGGIQMPGMDHGGGTGAGAPVSPAQAAPQTPSKPVHDHSKMDHSTRGDSGQAQDSVGSAGHPGHKTKPE